MGCSNSREIHVISDPSNVMKSFGEHEDWKSVSYYIYESHIIGTEEIVINTSCMEQVDIKKDASIKTLDLYADDVPISVDPITDQFENVDDILQEYVTIPKCKKLRVAKKPGIYNHQANRKVTLIIRYLITVLRNSS
jgi:hypothetical protein